MLSQLFKFEHEPCNQDFISDEVSKQFIYFSSRWRVLKIVDASPSFKSTIVLTPCCWCSISRTIRHVTPPSVQKKTNNRKSTKLHYTPVSLYLLSPRSKKQNYIDNGINKPNQIQFYPCDEIIVRPSNNSNCTPSTPDLKKRLFHHRFTYAP